MTSYAKPDVRTTPVTYTAFDHLHFYVGNAAQAAAYYITRFGFAPLAYRGLETGSRSILTHVVRQGDITLAFSSALTPDNAAMARHLATHGDGVHDVAFRVDDATAAYEAAVAAGGSDVGLSPPKTLTDEHGAVTVATIRAGWTDTTHTFVQRAAYTGAFLPGYRDARAAGGGGGAKAAGGVAPAAAGGDPLVTLVGVPGLGVIDHVVSNHADGDMERVVAWYERVLGWHRFWSVDDKQMHTEYSALRSVVVADPDEAIKMPINEPASGRRVSQIQEYLDYYGGAGVQHVALRTTDILRAVSTLRDRGVTFITVPDTYYEDLRRRLGVEAGKPGGVSVAEDLTALQALGVLVDFDETGYLLQIFTKPVGERPTLFLEIIQRAGNQGFGVGNFKSLFEAIEREQASRNNL